MDAMSLRTPVDTRRAEAARFVEAGLEVRDRVLHAPPAYVLSRAPIDVARQATLLEPVPPKRKARVVVTPLGDDWRVEVACRDRHGLLAVITSVLVAHDLDILDAAVATWPDGGAVESFTIRGPARPAEPAVLEAAIARAFGAPLDAPPLSEVEAVFDDASSQWYTVCEVLGTDRPGLLHAVTTAFAAAGACVHSARVGAVGGRVRDRFELTDVDGRKLGDAMKHAVRRTMRDGVARRHRRWGRRFLG